MVLFIDRFRSVSIPPLASGELEPVEVTEERKRVHSSRLQAEHTIHGVSTIGNINRGMETYIQFFFSSKPFPKLG